MANTTLTKADLEEILDRKFKPVQTKINDLVSTVEDLRKFISFANEKYEELTSKSDKLYKDFAELKKENSILKTNMLRFSGGGAV
jgi:chromosome segregation ATPase